MTIATPGKLKPPEEQLADWLTTLSIPFALAPLAAKASPAAMPFVTVANAAATQANAAIPSFGVADTAAHLLSGLPALSHDSHLTSLQATDAATLTLGADSYGAYRTTLDKLVGTQHMAINGLTAAQAAQAQADVHVGSFTVADTAAQVLAGLAALNADSHLASVTLTAGAPLALSFAQYQADHALVGKLAAGAATVGGVTAAAAAAVGADPHVQHLTVTDTLAHAGASLDTLEALAKTGLLTGIKVADAGQTLTLSAAQAAADHDAVALLQGDYHIIQGGNFVINLQYDASMAQAPSAMKAALTAAVQSFEGLFSTTETVTIRVGYGEVGGQAMGPGALGEAAPMGGVTVSYAAFQSALASHATTAAQKAAVAAMGGDPTHGGQIQVAGAEAKALGLIAANAAGIDGAMGFAVDPKGTLFATDPASRAVAGEYDFLGVAEHELSHALGRIAILDTAHHVFSPLDLFRYSAAGVHTVSATTAGYFSADGGRTNLDWYATSSDLGDWAASAGNDANTAYAHPGVVNAFTAADITQMNVLGYALA